MTQQNIKMMLRAFNGECDAAVAKVSWNNINTMEERIRRAYEAINKMGTSNRTYVTQEYLDLKLEELRLNHELQEKIQEEREEQRLIKEQMREEEKALRELQKQKEEAEREERRYQKALEKAQQDLARATGQKQAELEAQIKELQERLHEAEANKERAISQAQLTKLGHVYIISNIGSFGEQVYKIGMTRRLDPMDRVRELGDASVPFEFDVHAMIYSENAPELETALHHHFAQRRINLVNLRKEFFKVHLDEIEAFVKQRGLDIQLTKVAVAREFMETLALRKRGEGYVAEVLEEEEKEMAGRPGDIE
jgi:hypothetical protein